MESRGNPISREKRARYGPPSRWLPVKCAGSFPVSTRRTESPPREFVISTERTGVERGCCLQPRTEKMAGGSAHRELVATSTKITRVDLWCAKVLKAVEA